MRAGGHKGYQGHPCVRGRILEAQGWRLWLRAHSTAKTATGHELLQRRAQLSVPLPQPHRHEGLLLFFLQLARERGGSR